jgi:hypothetical protein
MSVWAVAMVRDEADIVGPVLARIRREVDHILVADNRSTDGTLEILRSTEGVTVLADPDPEFAMGRKLTALAQIARQRGASWIVPFAADEVLLARDGGRVADALAALPDDVLLAQAVVFDHVPTGQDPEGEDPIARMVYRRPDPKVMTRLAFRARPDLRIGHGGHTATFRDVGKPRVAEGLLVIRHFGVRSPEQFVRKTEIAAEGFAVTDLPPLTSIHRRRWVRDLDAGGTDAIVARFYDEFWVEDPEAAGLVRDPCP